MPSKPVEIQLSKLKLSLMLVGSLIFIALGIGLIWYDCVTPVTRNQRPYFGFFMGSLAILFSGFVGFYLFKKIFDKRPGLVINDDGITDNSGALSVGFIPWTDVVSLCEKRVGRQTFIHVEVTNPLEYIDRQVHALKRKWMKVNYKFNGSVISISANGLKCNHKELLKLLRSRFYRLK